MRLKFGLLEARSGDDELIGELLAMLQESHADYTLVFRGLGRFNSAPDSANERLREHFLNRDRFDTWAARYRGRLQDEGSGDDDRRDRMNRVNPCYVLRNYLAQSAIEKAQQGNYSEIARLFELLQDPYRERAGMDAYAAAPPNWGKHLTVSCSS
jgi:uncharacterized protein YdiU (UPF0061 family)